MTGSPLVRYTALMRLAFMGTPDFAVPTLDALLAAGHEVVAVYTQPPRPGGRRGKELTPSPVHKRAEAAGIEVRTPERLRGAEEQAAFAALELDAAVVAAYGLILPEPILQAPRHGCLNVHASLLPRWRGAAPIQRAILAGDEKTGVCIMQMEKGLDTGAILLEQRTRCAGKNAGYLTDELARMGGKMIVEALANIDTIIPRKQEQAGVTYASKIQKSETRIDFHQTAEQVDRQIDAFSPAPGAYFEFAGERFRILKADWDRGEGSPGVVINDELRIACGTDAISPVRVQRAGRAEMSVYELLRGFPIPAGTILA